TGACHQTDWTDGRFSAQIVASMEQSVLNLMKKARTRHVILIGYSGGAQIAGLIAVRHPDETVMLITLAGVLDHQAWTRFHSDEPLEKSLNLADFRAKLVKIPQHHFAGGKDDVVPPQLITDFAEAQTVTVLPKATHHKGFEKITNTIYQLGHEYENALDISR
ncbi:MAG: alpha/beta fold hydrolase, partial [Alphaproteobacteria bacterium]